MPKIYLYYAFNENRDVYYGQTGLNFEIIKNDTEKPLEKIKDDDLLLIDAHGSVDTPDQLIMTSPKGDKKVTANDLAQRLKTEGLKKTHQSILMASCEGGGRSSLKGVQPDNKGSLKANNLNLRSNSLGKCFASILAKSMGLAGYYSILVGGFPGIFNPISYTLNNKSAFRTNNNSRVLAELDHIQWFDCSGKNILVAYEI